MTPRELLDLLIKAAWQTALVLIAFVAFVLAAPSIWPNR